MNIKTNDLGQTHELANNDKITEHMLTKHELGELIRRAGIHLGFRPITEYRVRIDQTQSRDIDWVWLNTKTNKIIAAFEIEGADCGNTEVSKDLESLGNIDAGFKAVLLFQARKDEYLKPKDITINKFKGLITENIQLFFDTDLMDELEDFLLSFQGLR